MNNCVPEYKKDAFNCPHCGVFAHQKWSFIYADELCKSSFIFTLLERKGKFNIQDTKICVCQRCLEHSLWIKMKMVYPISSSAPLPTSQMPEDVKAEFEEARRVLEISPRSACALLRLSIQKLMPYIGGSGKNINNDIKTLVDSGIPKDIQQSLDCVRVIGNESVHPGTMDLRDDLEMAQDLFHLVNRIVEYTMSSSVHEKVYNKLPRKQLDYIEKRNST
ncbi:protein of unknown function [Methanolobus vulcani]|uniref:DUF4145 domain-containing protein n=2 Tax=Methanolobus vulcani TaxID=38026 RepID=A0A7Z7B065_9EURY|nr:protein of unknown function [Methanolobus vulcani]